MDNNNHSVSPGHDAEAEVNIRGILIFLVILTATVVMVQLAAGRLIGCFENAAAKRDERATSQREEASIAGSRAYFPKPREQVSPHDDLLALRAREEKDLHAYAWIDRKTGVVQIPIDRAMELISQRGLPVRSSTNGAKLGPSSLELQQQRARQSTPPGKEEEK